MGENPNALADVRVLDLSSFIAGPYCTKLLADFGADVIKVEPLGGDTARTVGPFHHDQPHQEGSLLFLYLNSNKRSLTLNLEHPLGRSMLKRLAAWADVIVESFKPGTLSELDLGYASLSEVKSNIVLVSITPFGQDGPYSDFKGSDIVEFAMGGFMYTYGEYDREPLKHGGYQTQYHAGTNAAVATMVAVYNQRASGEGQHVDVSSIESQAVTLRDTTSLYAYSGAIRRRAPKQNSEEGGSVVACRDGYIVGGDGGIPRSGLRPMDWDQVVEFVGSEKLREFASEEDRLQRRSELRSAVAEAYSQRSKYELVDAAQQRHIMFGPAETPADVVNSPQLAARNYFAPMEHPHVGVMNFPGEPFTMSETPWRMRRPAPLLGQHNVEVYRDLLGYSERDVVGMRELHVI